MHVGSRRLAAALTVLAISLSAAARSEAAERAPVPRADGGLLAGLEAPAPGACGGTQTCLAQAAACSKYERPCKGIYDKNQPVCFNPSRSSCRSGVVCGLFEDLCTGAFLTGVPKCYVRGAMRCLHGIVCPPTHNVCVRGGKRTCCRAKFKKPRAPPKLKRKIR